MKTKIRTNLAILALATIGFININAIADNKKSVIVDINSTKTESLLNEFWMTEATIAYSAEAFSYRDAIEEIEKFEAEQNLAEENTLKEESLIYSAKVFSDLDFEKEIEEYAAK